ncbi:MAG TPA: hypothetical protein VGO07_04210, partial [Candidatus Saccharimonadales bacterium]|nr:hypothetical protein [Candidatus Saccharimonadales bacterium]
MFKCTSMDVTEKLLSEAGLRDLPQTLGELGGRALQSALLDAYDIRAAALDPADVLRQYETSDLTEPCTLDQREIIRFENFVVDTIPEQFNFVELSPVTALGSNSVLASVSQKNVLGTTRNTEVVADGVTVLTLEAAKRQRSVSHESTAMHLGTLHRETRTQQHEHPGFTSHFHALSLISNERTSQPDDFKGRSFAEHTSAYLDVIKGASAVGYEARGISVALSNIRVLELIMKNQGLDKDAIMRRTQTPGFDAFRECNIALPSHIEPEELPTLLASLQPELSYLARTLAYTGRIFEPTIESIRTVYGSEVHTYFDLSRHAGIGYYQDAAVKISAETPRG